jgi:hypothetical protein
MALPLKAISINFGSAVSSPWGRLRGGLLFSYRDCNNKIVLAYFIIMQWLMPKKENNGTIYWTIYYLYLVLYKTFPLFCCFTYISGIVQFLKLLVVLLRAFALVFSYALTTFKKNYTLFS